MRYAYGVAAALLLGGTAFSVATGQAGAQVAQNAPAAIAPRAGAPTIVRRSRRAAAAGGGQHLDQAARRRCAARPTRSRNSSAASAARRRQAPRQRPGAAPAPAPPTREAGSLGSGFIISPDGYVVTNNHLIQGASGTGTVDSVTVILTDRKEYPARIIGRDAGVRPRPAQDRGQQPAVRQLRRFDPRPGRRLGDRDRQSLRPWRHRHRRHHLGASPRHHRRRRLRPLHPDRRQHQHGQFGRPDVRPGGQRHRHQFGADLADRRQRRHRPRHPRRSGQAGDRFAAPRPARRSAAISASASSRSTRISPPRSACPRTSGEIVRSVVPGQAAARAGIQQGDVIVRVNGQPVTPDQTRRYLIANTPVGSRVPIEHHPRRPPPDGHRRSSASARPRKSSRSRSAAATTTAHRWPRTRRSRRGTALGLSLQTLTPQIAPRASTCRRRRAAWSSPRSIRRATPPTRACAAAT